MRPGYHQTEIGELPEDWNVVKVGDVLAEISMGPFGSDIKVSNFVSNGVPVLSGDNIRTYILKDKFSNFLTPTKAESLKKAVARRGDVVVTHRGTIGQIAYIPKNSAYQKYVISQSQFRARFSDRVNPDWVALYFLSDRGSKDLLEGKGHTGVPAIAQATTTFRKLLMPLPPPDEQTAIAAALSDVDAAAAGLERLIAKKRDIKQAAMQRLLTGQTRLPGFSGEWKESRLRDVCKIIRGASPRPIDSPIWFDSQSSVGWVRISDVTRSGMFLSETTQKLSRKGIALSRRVPIGGLIMSIAATVGRPAITAIDTCIHDGFVHLSNPSLDKTFLFYLLKSLEPNWSMRGQTGSQMNLNTGIIGNAEVHAPCRTEEQIAIAAVLSDIDAELSALQAELDKTRLIKQAMMQELLTGRTRLPIKEPVDA